MKFSIPKIDKILYWGILLMIIKTFLFYSVLFHYPDWVDSVLEYSAVVCFVASIIQLKYSTKTMLWYGIITLVSVFSCYQIKEWGMLITVITVLAIRRENINKVINFIFKYELLLFVMHIICAILMSLFGFSLTSTYNGEIVYSMGFVHRNTLSAIAFNLIIMWIWLNYKSINKYQIAMIFLLEGALFYFVKTKTSTSIAIAILVFLLVFRNKEKTSNVLKFCAALIVPMFTVVIFYLISNFGNNLSLFLDVFLTGRLRLNAYLLNQNGLTLFGQAITSNVALWDETFRLSGNITFDCLYSYLIISRGCIWTILISVLFFKLAYKGINSVNLFIIAWGLYAVTEVGGLNCYFCFPIILVVLLFDNKIQEVCAFSLEKASKIYRNNIV